MKYEIKGEMLPVVICELEAGEKVITENGGMSWMSPNLTMETTTNGGAGKAFGRMFTGESIFLNIYTANGPGMIAFSSHFPGQIRKFDITPGNEIILQKTAFLASEIGVVPSVFFNKKIGNVFFGEGLILQKYSGTGMLFAELNGYVQEYVLAPGQQIVMETGLLVGMDASCKMDIVSVKGIKNKFLGGEGFFNTVVTGPGRVWIHTMPVSKLARTLAPYLPNKS